MLRSLSSQFHPTQPQPTRLGELPYYVLLAALKTHWRIETPVYLRSNAGYQLILRPCASIPLPIVCLWFWATILRQRLKLIGPASHWLITSLRSGAFLLMAPDTTSINRLVRSQRLRVISVQA